MGFNFYSPITVNSSQVPSTQTDFPMLISLTDNRFKSAANGGHVAHSGGFDIRPYSDAALTTALTGYELERYNPTTGEVIMWVKISSLSNGNVTYLAYGDAGINVNASSTTTWSNNFAAVYHLADGSALNVNSSTGTNNGTNNGTTATTGQIDGAGNFVSASSQYVDLGTAVNNAATALTYSVWVKATSFPDTVKAIIARVHAGNTAYTAIQVNSATGKLAMYVLVSGPQDVHYDGTGINTLSTGTWYYIVLTYSDIGTTLTGYVNATVDGSSALAGNRQCIVTPTSTYIGNDPINASRFWNGVIDEVRVANVARSSDWITTEYNNQFAPSTFATLGTEVANFLGIYTK